MPRRSELKITKRTVDALNVEAGDALFWDRELAGFGVRVHATGRKVYVVQSRGPGGPKRVTLGRHGEMPADEARRRAALVIDRIKRGEDLEPRPPVAELTVAGLAERFMRVHVGVHCKPGTAAGYRSVLEGHILPALGGMPAAAVGRGEVSALHHRLRSTPIRANAAVNLLSEMFSLAGAWELTPPGRNPCRGLRRYRTRPRERFLSDEEFRRLGRALKDAEAEGTIWPPALAAIRLLILTGCRRGEILGLRREDVDRTAGELRLRDAFLVAETRSGRRGYLLEWKYTEAYVENDMGQGRKGRTRRRRYAKPYAASPAFRGGVPLDAWLHEPFFQIMRQRLLADRMVLDKELGVSEAKVVLVVPDGNFDYRQNLTSPYFAARFPEATTVEEVIRAAMNVPDRDFGIVSQSVLGTAVRAMCGGSAHDWSEYHAARYGW